MPNRMLTVLNLFHMPNGTGTVNSAGDHIHFVRSNYSVDKLTVPRNVCCNNQGIEPLFLDIDMLTE